MKRFAMFFLGLLFLIPFAASADELSGRQIIEMQKTRHAVKSDTATIVMLLIDQKGNEKQRLMERYAKEFENGLKRGLVVFEQPKDIAGTALLTWELEDGQSKQWIYLPEVKKMQRIASKSQKSSFMGTDFTYEDLQPDNLENYRYTILGSETIEDGPCHMIEIVPVTREKEKESAYSKRIVWVRKDIFFTVKIEFYDRRGRLLKTQTNYDLINLQGSVWSAKKSLMLDHKTQHKTLMGAKRQEINTPIDDAVFTERFVLSGKHLR